MTYIPKEKKHFIKNITFTLLLIFLFALVLLLIRMQPEKLESSDSMTVDEIVEIINTDSNLVQCSLELTDTNKPFKADNILNGIGKIIYNKAIMIDGKKQYLYPEFESMSEAINSINAQYSGIINNMRFTYLLPSFSIKTWPNYANRFTSYQEKHMNKTSTTNNESGISDEQIGALGEFFDIAENSDKNRYIITIVNEIKKGSQKNKDGTIYCSKDALELLWEQLPDN